MATALSTTYRKKKPSVLKRIRQTERRAAINKASHSRLRTQIKKLRQAIESGKTDAAASLLRPTLSLIDKMIQKGILHRNPASRQKSPLTRRTNALQK